MSGTEGPEPASAPIGLRLLPIVAIAVFVTFIGAIVVAAATSATLGFDFLAYHGAAVRVLEGQPLYDPTVQQTGGFGLFYYPPPFVLAVLPLAALPGPVAVLVWTALMLAAFGAGVALMPVPVVVRWLTVLLAGLSWPFGYAIKLGQVGPLLFLLFAMGWRWLDRPGVLGTASAGGAIVKLQPGLLVVWAVLTGRRQAAIIGVAILAAAAGAASVLAGGPSVWFDYAALLRNVSDPIATPHNFTPGAVAYQMGAPAGPAAALQLTVSALAAVAVAVASRAVAADASYLVAVVASQLLSPVLWDHYAMLLLLPTAWLIARGHVWAVAVPLATSTVILPIVPAAAYPVAFGVTMVAVLAVAWRAVPRERSASVTLAA
ncbi:MAG TPA: glycosyltransferase family 87 protein [Candidatus Limnocylindrales bacterium]|nr:glycosyltransferase family 87 protein [Candidatus Limnocylindrales bacterium]